MGFGTSGRSGLKGSREWSHRAQNAWDHLQPAETPRVSHPTGAEPRSPSRPQSSITWQLLGALQLRSVVQSTGQKEKKKSPATQWGLLNDMTKGTGSKACAPSGSWACREEEWESLAGTHKHARASPGRANPGSCKHVKSAHLNPSSCQRQCQTHPSV